MTRKEWLNAVDKIDDKYINELADYKLKKKQSSEKKTEEAEAVLKPKYYREDSSSKFPFKKVMIAVAAFACVAAVGVFIWVKSNPLPVSPNDSAGISSEVINSAGNSEASATSVESTAPTPSDITLQKISELREELETQINTVKSADYINLHTTEDFVVKIPDSDIMYDLTLTADSFDFKEYYDKFDKIFDREFGDVYTQEDKDKLYHASFEGDIGEMYRSDGSLLKNRIDELESGEKKLGQLYVDSDKAYLTLYLFGTGVYGLNHDGILKRAGITEVKFVAMTDATNYFEIVKNYLDADSEDKYTIIDKELSIKEASEKVKEMTAEYGYSWGGSLEPEVYQVKVLDIGEGKYGLSFTLTPSYKGVMFDTYEFPSDGSMSVGRKDTLEHDYDLFMPHAFMMEYGKFETFRRGDSAYTAKETAAHNSVISFKDAVQMLSEKFGAGMDLSLSRAELMYSGMYSENDNDDSKATNDNPENNNSVKKAHPVWKFRCHNLTDDLKYIIYVNAINGNVEYYTTDWWEV